MRLTLLLCFWFITQCVFAQDLSMPAAQRPFMQDLGIHMTHSKIEYGGKLGSYEVKEKVVNFFGYDGEIGKSVSTDSRTVSVRLSGRRSMVKASINYRTDAVSEIIEVTMDESVEPITTTFFSVPCDSGSHFFGGGEQFSHVELTGKKIPFLVEENGIGRSNDAASRLAGIVGADGHEWSTYCPIPLVISSFGYAYLIENDCYSEIDLSEEGRIGFKVHDDTLKLRVWKAESPKALISHTSNYLGRQGLVPEWTYGTWLGLQGGKSRVNRILKETQAFGNPVSAIWIQDWVGKKDTKIGSRLHWEWKPDETVYPNFKHYTDSLNETGIKVLGYINPFLLEGTEMCKDALQKELVVRKFNKEPYLIPFGGFDGYILDLSKPETQAWIKEIIKTNMIGNGLTGWMADFAEWLPFDAILYSGQDSKDYHNRFAADWARLNREAIQEAGKEGEVIFFSRSGWTGSSKYSPVFWAGDQLVDFSKADGLPSAVNAMISSSISGMFLNHSDIGGYTGFKFPFFKNYLRDKEALFRWIEFEAFTPFFRTHEGLLPEEMVQFYSDSSTQEFFARFGQIHKQLQPYFQRWIKKANEVGIPIIRHPWVEFPFDMECLNTEYQFFVGRHMIVAPVTEQGQLGVTAYLPAGDWIHLFSKKKYKGRQWVTVEAPIGTPAVWVKKDSEVAAMMLGQ
ncbi:MAG: alpha-glucosidase [Bacteroidia bacterium]|jgi:alpha-glucosidase